jgi:hypothetical protein
MKRVHRWIGLCVAPTLALALGLAGCNKDDKAKDDKGKGDGKVAKDEKEKKNGEPAPAGAPTPIDAKYDATVKGKVLYDGDPPAREDLTPEIKKNSDPDHCMKGDTKDPKWMVGPQKGVQNVVVWIRAPKGKYFKLPDDLKKWSGEQPVMDQPFCAFQPHVIDLYPSYFDGKKQQPTGQQFKVKNSAPIGHNTAWEGNKVFNPGDNQKIAAGGELPVAAKPALATKTGDDVVRIRCDLHKYMRAYAYVFDHPFHAVTKEDGTFEIKNAPAGTEVELAYWHESHDPEVKTQKITLKDGENSIPDIKIKK